MQHLELTLPSPAENLACDEALLDDRERHGGPGILRFWESTVSFIVVGYANKVAEEVQPEAVRRLAIPVLRRCSGGGTVVQGPGCLNYSVILPLDAVGPQPTITATNRFVMERHRDTLARLLGEPVEVAGHTDLAIGDRKFSGNAQRRKREWFLFHGTFLLPTFDLALIASVLRPPPREPDYRRQRAHLEFVRPLPLAAAAITRALRHAWSVTAPLDTPDELARIHEATETLARGRYRLAQWNERW
jgi:lipoate-protein ligase A